LSKETGVPGRGYFRAAKETGAGASDCAKNKTEPREGICEHLQSTAPHNATGNEAFIIEAVPPFVCGVH